MAVQSRPTVAREWREHVIVFPEYSGGDLYFLGKRTIDIVLTVTCLLLLLPLLAVIAVLIKLDSAGPVFFLQERVGARRQRREGEVQWEVCPFFCYKFRSMVHGADQSIHQSHAEAFVEGRVDPGEDHAAFKLANDSRVTRVGKILRQTSLDELPQLFNVLRGEMSLVGPRPVPTYEAAKYQPSHWQRLSTVPGLTGLWQICGRGQVSFETMLQMDIEYIRNQSLWLDFKLLVLTVPALFSRRGAY